MNRPVKNVEQIRSLLGKMDRLIDDARNKREGVGREGGGRPMQLPQQPSMQPPSAAPLARPMPTNMSHAAPMQPKPIASPTPHIGNGTNGNGHHAPQQAQPQRLKAKPKRATNDPLQDFQQRQAS